MKLQLSQRLIGLLSILALLFIFTFVWLKDHDVMHDLLSIGYVRIPDPPKLDYLHRSLKPSAFNNMLSSPHTVRKHEQQAWLIQLASFNEKDLADALVAKLRQQGYAAYSLNRKNTQDEWVTRVFVGPELNKQKAELILAGLQQSMYSSAFIRSYQPGG